MQFAIYLWLLLSTLATLSSAACSTLSLPFSNCTVPGTPGNIYGLELTLSNSSQYVCVVPSTVVNSTLLIGSDYCQHYANGTTAQCESLSGNTFNILAAGRFYNASTPSAVLGSNPVWSEINSQALDAGTTSLYLPPNHTVPNYPIGIITGGNNQNAGHLGLAPESQFLQAANESGLISQRGFGLDAGSQSIAHPRPGLLVLGGYDQASISVTVPPSVYQIGSPSNSERECPLQVTITQLTLRFPLPGGNNTDFDLTEAGIDVPACVEPYDNLFRLPPTLLQIVQQKTSWSADTETDPNLFVVEPGLLYPQSMGFNGSLIIKLEGYDNEVEIPNYELSQPLRGLAANGTQVLNTNLTELKIFHEAPLLNTAVLGKIFLSQVYLIVDYDQMIFKLAQPDPESTSTNIVPLDSTSAICSANPDASHDSTHRATILGLAISLSLATTAAVAVAICLLIRDRRRQTRNRVLEEIQLNPPSAVDMDSPAPPTSSPRPVEPATMLQGEHLSQASDSESGEPPYPEAYLRVAAAGPATPSC
ncbi:hypothetical protein N431DRAFT_476046 [Stipitochalara longipes BDJ]|nr:hypothetical protein N431DRAFT_476046 [Stipitochalara longipes BDJ]